MEESRLIIPDASTLIKWTALEDDDLENALRLREDFTNKKCRILIPALCMWEINNFLGRNLDTEGAMHFFSIFKQYNFRQAMPTFEISHLAFQLMKKAEKISFYDASYHSLAISSEGTFLTADKKYFEKTKKFGHIKLLSNY